MNKKRIEDIIVEQSLNNEEVLKKVVSYIKFGIKNIPLLTTSNYYYSKYKKIYDVVGIKIKKIDSVQDYNLARYLSCGEPIGVNCALVYYDELSEEQIKKMLMKKYKMDDIKKLKARAL